MQVSTICYDDFIGRQASGRILEGSIKKGQQVIHIDETGKQTRATITRIEGYRGLEKIELEEAHVGDIVILSGIPSIMIGDTLCDPSKIVQLPPIKLDEPTVSIDFTVNNSPFVGRSGKHVTMNKLRDRLEKKRKQIFPYVSIQAMKNYCCRKRELHSGSNRSYASRRLRIQRLKAHCCYQRNRGREI